MEFRKLEGDLMYCMCVSVCVVCIVYLNKCVWSSVSPYFKVGSSCVQYTEQTAEQTPLICS